FCSFFRLASSYIAASFAPSICSTRLNRSTAVGRFSIVFSRNALKYRVFTSRLSALFIGLLCATALFRLKRQQPRTKIKYMKQVLTFRPPSLYFKFHSICAFAFLRYSLPILIPLSCFLTPDSRLLTPTPPQCDHNHRRHALFQLIPRPAANLLFRALKRSFVLYGRRY